MSDFKNPDLAVCAICGKTYKVCLSCKKFTTAKPWRSITDTIDCYKLFLILSQYNQGYITKEEAKAQLETVSFCLEDLKESVQNKIAEILSETADMSRRAKNKEVSYDNQNRTCLY